MFVCVRINNKSNMSGTHVCLLQQQNAAHPSMFFFFFCALKVLKGYCVVDCGRQVQTSGADQVINMALVGYVVTLTVHAS